MSERFTVRVASPNLRFCAAHFVIFGPDKCEPVHGHDFRVSAVVEGRLAATGWVLDFVFLERTLANIIRDFDHVLLLPESSPWVRVTKDGPFLEINAGPRSWKFPSEDCRLLPIANVTAELLARHIGLLLQEQLRAQVGDPSTELERIIIELSEAEGYIGSWTIVLSES
ncbi:MAG: 6-pyruvoyl trahydropterin synthase family protein [Thermogutta sp.]